MVYRLVRELPSVRVQVGAQCLAHRKPESRKDSDDAHLSQITSRPARSTDLEKSPDLTNRMSRAAPPTHVPLTTLMASGDRGRRTPDSPGRDPCAARAATAFPPAGPIIPNRSTIWTETPEHPECTRRSSLSVIEPEQRPARRRLVMARRKFAGAQPDGRPESLFGVLVVSIMRAI